MSDCWCCDRGTPVSPRVIFNRPALSALNYRVGTFSSFRRAMIETIATEPLLLKWTSRDADDYGIEIVELWAYLADVLTFYQERIANEAFLRTTTQRDSLMRLAALIDYTNSRRHSRPKQRSVLKQQSIRFGCCLCRRPILKTSARMPITPSS